MLPAPGAPRLGAATRLRTLRLPGGAPADDLEPEAPHPADDDRMLEALERRFGSLKRCYTPPRRRPRRGLKAWLARLWNPDERRRRARFDLARNLSSLHAGSRYTRGEMFSGSTGAFSVPDLFAMVRSSGKTGRLGLALGGERVSFDVAGGRVLSARSTNAPPEERLGAILVRQGALNRKALRSILARQKRLDGQLGGSLLRHRLVTREQLQDAVREQLRHTLRRSQAAADAPFVFQEGEVDEAPDGLRLGVDELLLEVARLQDEEAHASALDERLREYRPGALGALNRLVS